MNAAKRELDGLKKREEQLKGQRVQQQGEGSQVSGCSGKVLVRLVRQ